MNKNEKNESLMEKEQKRGDITKPLYCITCVSGKSEPTSTIEDCRNMFCVGKILGKESSTKLMTELNQMHNASRN